MANRKSCRATHRLGAAATVIVANRFGQTRTGRAVMRCPCGWVLNMGGPHGTPAVATEETLVKVVSRRERREPVLPMGDSR